MTSQYWDAGQAHAYHEFQYHFPEKTLAGKTIIFAGGASGLGAASVALLAKEGGDLVVGYRANCKRAETLRRAIPSSYGRSLSLVAVASAEVRETCLAVVQKFAAPLAGVAIFPGEPARVAFENLNRETLLASLESNYAGPMLLAREIGAVMEATLLRDRT